MDFLGMAVSLWDLLILLLLPLISILLFVVMLVKTLGALQVSVPNYIKKIMHSSKSK
jgi:hypothetical protein